MNPYDFMDVAHAFGGGMYIKQCNLKQGFTYGQHKHAHDHLSILASGVADIEVDGQKTRFVGPIMVTIVAGKAHSITAVTPVLWYCCHATDETDVEHIDEELIA
jgi:quercetin dioxygenase-like cupin family protein